MSAVPPNDLALSGDDLAYATGPQLAAAYRSGALSPVAVTEALLERIERGNGPLHAFIKVTRERALAEARAAEAELKAGHDRGPLHGVPYAAKDLYDVKGEATTAGISLLAGNVKDEDGFVIRRLAQAGMVLLGKTYTVQFALGPVGMNSDHGHPHNPWHKDPHAPGGSSSGSGVAVAAGLAPMALGSDTGGSVRIPAAMNGTVGLKTTVGRISRAGVYPLCHTLDSVGPLTRSVEDAALTYQAMAGTDFADETTVGVPPHDVLRGLKDGVKGLRVAVCESALFVDADPQVEQAVREAARVFASLGAQVESVELPELEAVRTDEGARAITVVEACHFNRRFLDDHFDQMDPLVRERMIAGRQTDGPTFFGILRTMQARRASLLERLRDIDVFLGPSVMIPAEPLSQMGTPEAYYRHSPHYSRNTSIGNYLGLCAVSLPCGFAASGLPLSLMVHAKPFDEGTALRAAYAYEQATEWHARRPALDWAGL